MNNDIFNLLLKLNKKDHLIELVNTPFKLKIYGLRKTSYTKKIIFNKINIYINDIFFSNLVLNTDGNIIYSINKITTLKLFEDFIILLKKFEDSIILGDIKILSDDKNTFSISQCPRCDCNKYRSNTSFQAQDNTMKKLEIKICSDCNFIY